jgi:type I restriction enzyme M protein
MPHAVLLVIFMVNTLPLESATRKKIDVMLNNLGWNTDEESPACNVFTERAKTEEQNTKFKGKNPDYTLYQSNTDNPIAIIEAKRKGQNIDDALKQAEEKYAIPLKVKIIFAYDGAFFKSWHVENKKELVIDGQTLTQLVSEKKILQFIKEGYAISDVTPRIKHTRSELISIFRWANDMLRNEGLREGIERFTEFANFLFLKLISEMEEERENQGEERILPKQYSWESFCDLEAQLMLNYINNTVLPYLVKKYNHSGDVFQKELAIKNPKRLKKIVDRLSTIRLIDSDSDVKGDAFEYFLKNSITIGNDLGEYFTPRHIVNLMIDLTEPKFGERVYDPTCGTGGFLIGTFNYVKRRCANTKDNMSVLKEHTVYGRELTSTAKIAKMNMILTGDGHTNIQQMDSLENPVKHEYDLVLANPPYGQDTDFGSYYPIPSLNGDAIFIQHIFMSLKEGGRAGVIIPEGLLFRGSADQKVREYLLQNAEVEAVISLPPGVFRPYAKGNKTSIIILKKSSKGTKKVWFYDLKQDGFDLDSDMRPPIEENDIPDLLSKWSEKLNSENSWNVDFDTIKAHGYELMAKTYMPEIEVREDKKVPFSTFIKLSKEKVMIDENKMYKQVTIKLNGKGATLRREVSGNKIKTKNQFIVRDGQLVMSKIDARNGAIAVIPKELDGAIVTQDFPVFNVDYSSLDRHYLEMYLRYNDLGSKLVKFSKGTTNRRRVKPDNLLNLRLEIPSIPEQKKIAEAIDKEAEIIRDAELRISKLAEKIKQK